MTIPCFVCSRLMNGGSGAYWCERCDVFEEHLNLYVNLVRTVPCAPATFGGIRYIDHSTEHYPSPA